MSWGRVESAARTSPGAPGPWEVRIDVVNAPGHQQAVATSVEVDGNAPHWVFTYRFAVPIYFRTEDRRPGGPHERTAQARVSTLESALDNMHQNHPVTHAGPF